MTIVILYAFVFCLFFGFLRINRDSGFSKDYSTAIKGLFILLIVLSHTLNYIPYYGFGSTAITYFRRIMGQFCVSPFFFISGFGLFEGYKKNGNEYNVIFLF